MFFPILKILEIRRVSSRRASQIADHGRFGALGIVVTVGNMNVEWYDMKPRTRASQNANRNASPFNPNRSAGVERHRMNSSLPY